VEENEEEMEEDILNPRRRRKIGGGVRLHMIDFIVFDMINRFTRSESPNDSQYNDDTTQRRKRNKLAPQLARMMGEANMHYIQKDFAKAVDLLLQVVKQNPHVADPFHTLGLIYQEWKQPEKAAEYFMIAAHMSPKDAMTWKKVAEIWKELGKTSQAVYCYSRVIKLTPTDEDALESRARLCSQDPHDSRRAIDSYTQLLKLRPGNLTNIKGLARVYFSVSQTEKAVEILMDGFKQMQVTVESSLIGPIATQIAPDLELINMLAEGHMLHESYDAAMEILQWAHRRHGRADTMPLELSVNLALCLLHQGETHSAKQALRRLLAHSPLEYGDMYFKVAVAMSNVAGDYATSLEYLLELIRNPAYNQPSVLLRIAQCHRALNHTVQAIDYFQRVFEQSGDVEACLALSELTSQRGDHQQVLRIINDYHERQKQQRQQQAAEAVAAAAAEAGGDNKEGIAINEGTSTLPELPRTLPTPADVRVSVIQAFSYFNLSHYDLFVEVALDVLHDRRLLFFRRRRQRFRSTKRPTLPGYVKPDDTAMSIPKAARRRSTATPRKGAGTAAANATSGDNPSNINDGDAMDVDPPQQVDPSTQQQQQQDDAQEQDELEPGAEQIAALDDGIDASQRGLASQSILEILGVDEYMRLVFAASKALVWVRRFADAFRTVRICTAYILGEGSIDIDLEHENMLRYLASKVAYLAGEYAFASRQMRAIHPHKPYNVALWNHFYKVISKASVFTVSSRYLERQLARHPDCVPLRLLVGHHAAMSGSYGLALAEYFPAFQLRPNNPTVCLSIGLAYLNQSMSRKVADRHYHVMLAFAFLWRYAELSGWSQEAYYNMGRAFQQLSLHHFAINMYEKALQVRPASVPEYDLDTGAFIRQRPIQEPVPDEASADLSREIAFNLATMYRTTGSPHLARQLLQSYLTI
jgi:general transcription factor 3C polypeptide 3 (transcription factor C subunit 4)